jgi:hypothetical protein
MPPSRGLAAGVNATPFATGTLDDAISAALEILHHPALALAERTAIGPEIRRRVLVAGDRRVSFGFEQALYLRSRHGGSVVDVDQSIPR